MSKNESPLRYPGGKTRACKILHQILNEHFNINDYETLISPFFGGGSFEFYIQNTFGLDIIANDKFTPLYNFWITCKTTPEEFTKQLEIKLGTITKDIFTEYRNQIITLDDSFLQSIMYFIINRCSFSGATLSGGFSQDASENRFTQSSINKIKRLNLNKLSIYNDDFSEFIENHSNESSLLFLDPPYYLEKKSKLYGKNGDMHETFDHEQLFNVLSNKKKWLLTYNNCEFIKEKYKKYKIIETSWSYGMNKSKESSEIVILSI